jgi:hypothetical protein
MDSSSAPTTPLRVSSSGNFITPTRPVPTPQKSSEGPTPRTKKIKAFLALSPESKEMWTPTRKQAEEMSVSKKKLLNFVMKHEEPEKYLAKLKTKLQKKRAALKAQNEQEADCHSDLLQQIYNLENTGEEQEEEFEERVAQLESQIEGLEEELNGFIEEDPNLKRHFPEAERLRAENAELRAQLLTQRSNYTRHVRSHLVKELRKKLGMSLFMRRYEMIRIRNSQLRRMNRKLQKDFDRAKDLIAAMGGQALDDTQTAVTGKAEESSAEEDSSDDGIDPIDTDSDGHSESSYEAPKPAPAKKQKRKRKRKH